MPSQRTRRRTNKPERLPVAATYARRLADLRQLLDQHPSDAGDQALKLLEEYLETLAEQYGYQGDGSMRRYSQFLRGTNALDDTTLARIDAYNDARNCLAHTYGLQTTPEFAAELVDFLAALLHTDASAEHLMTSTLQTIDSQSTLAAARDLMLARGYGRIPVLDQRGQVLGILTERDLVQAQLLAERAHRPLSAIPVIEALPLNASSSMAFVAPEANRATVLDRLCQPGIIACLVTPQGRPDLPPRGIITHADMLYR
ncbi:MAG: hypothetical protein Fur005_00150 [Roseiflexaceae bacterium]